MDNEILFEKLSKGDKLAFEQVFDTYYTSVCLFIRKYRIGEKQAEDIAQDVFTKIWEKRLHYPNSFAFRSYLYQTAKNLALNALAHEGVKNRYHETVFINQEFEDFFHRNYIQQETTRLLIQHIENLPPRAKEILYLNLEGYRNREISDILGITVSTVKSHKATAYKLLRERL